MKIETCQWYMSSKTKRLFVIKDTFYKGIGSKFNCTQVVLLEAMKEEPIYHFYEDFVRLVEEGVLVKIS